MRTAEQRQLVPPVPRAANVPAAAEQAKIPPLPPRMPARPGVVTHIRRALAVVDPLTAIRARPAVFAAVLVHIAAVFILDILAAVLFDGVAVFIRHLIAEILL